MLDAELLRSQPVRQSIGEHAGIPWESFSVDGQTGEQTASTNQPNQIERSTEIVSESSPTRLYFTVNPNYPIINLYAQAPTATGATDLVEAAANSLIAYTSDLQNRLDVPDSDRAQLLKLGDPETGTVAGGASRALAVLLALFILIVGCFLILWLSRVVSAVRGATRRARPRPGRLDPLDTARPDALRPGRGRRERALEALALAELTPARSPWPR